jgi:hypothetical protein
MISRGGSSLEGSRASAGAWPPGPSQGVRIVSGGPPVSTGRSGAAQGSSSFGGGVGAARSTNPGFRPSSAAAAGPRSGAGVASSSSSAARPGSSWSGGKGAGAGAAGSGSARTGAAAGGAGSGGASGRGSSSTPDAAARKDNGLDLDSSSGAGAAGADAGTDLLAAAVAEQAAQKRREARKTFKESDLLGQRGLFTLYRETQRLPLQRKPETVVRSFCCAVDSALCLADGPLGDVCWAVPSCLWAVHQRWMPEAACGPEGQAGPCRPRCDARWAAGLACLPALFPSRVVE